MATKGGGIALSRAQQAAALASDGLTKIVEAAQSGGAADLRGLIVASHQYGGDRERALVTAIDQYLLAYVGREAQEKKAAIDAALRAARAGTRPDNGSGCSDPNCTICASPTATSIQRSATMPTFVIDDEREDDE